MRLKHLRLPLLAVTAACVSAMALADDPRIDYLSLAQGAIPVASGGAAEAPGVGMDRALLAIDGDARGYSVTPKPGAADARVFFVFQLPASTTFTDFAVPNVLETPSPSQTFFKTVEIAGSDHGPEGPFQVLASASLKTHAAKGQMTDLPVTAQTPVRWVRLTLSGGIDIQREKTFFEFSEIIGYGRQEPVPLQKAFTGKWKGRGVLLELRQDGIRVGGCYDKVGDLTGTVDGNILRATGKTRTGGIPSTFVLTVTDAGEIIGVRSTNHAPFHLYTGNAAPGITTECAGQAVPSLGCGSVVHGIHFGFDSAVIRPDSNELLDALATGLKAARGPVITVIGHTSSEGSDGYNEELSQRRAEAVVTGLVARGIDAATIAAQGRGENEPIADNATGAGRSLNRRVAISCRGDRAHGV